MQLAEVRMSCTTPAAQSRTCRMPFVGKSKAVQVFLLPSIQSHSRCSTQQQAAASSTRQAANGSSQVSKIMLYCMQHTKDVHCRKDTARRCPCSCNCQASHSTTACQMLTDAAVICKFKRCCIQKNITHLVRRFLAGLQAAAISSQVCPQQLLQLSHATHTLLQLEK